MLHHKLTALFLSLGDLLQKLNQNKTFFPSQMPSGLFLLLVSCQISLYANTKSGRHLFPPQLPAPGQNGRISLEMQLGNTGEVLEMCTSFSWCSKDWLVSFVLLLFTILLSAETPDWCLDQLSSSFSLTQNDFFFMPMW